MKAAALIREILKKFLSRRAALRLPASFLLLFAASLAVTALMFLFQPNTGVSVWPLIRESRGLIFLLNWLPVVLVMAAAFFLTGNLTAACGVPGFLWLGLSVINRYMVAMRWAPLQPYDLLLGMEFTGIARSIRPAVFITAGAGAAAFALVFVLCLRALKNTKPRGWVRLLGLVFCAALAVALNAEIRAGGRVYAGPYADRRLYEALPRQGSAYNITDQYQSKGYAYHFLYTLNTSRFARPEYYGRYREQIAAAESQASSGAARDPAAPRPDALVKPPHMIMVLSEAFSEIPFCPELDFTGHTDPLARYRAVKAESLAGYLVVPHTGGGTADTEFDILTGLNARDFRGVPYAFTLITRPFPGFPAAMRASGYAAQALHPGAAWFYNRQNVYPLLGFEAFIDGRDFPLEGYKGLYVSEALTMDRLISLYRAHLDADPGTPLLLSCITIQNHGPYLGKYDGVDVNFQTDRALSGDDTQALAQYFAGLADCDRELARLVAFLRDEEAPAVLVYYGDHQPSLPPHLYPWLLPEPEGVPASARELALWQNRVPFIIWANEAARDSLDTAAFEAGLPRDRTISAHYLGAALLEMAGLTGADPLMDLLNHMRPVYPVVLERAWLDGAGELRVFEPERDEPLALYRSWAYHRIKES